MKFVVFGAQRRVGLLHGDSVVDVNNAAVAYLSTKMSPAEAVVKAAQAASADLAHFIAAGNEALDLARAGAEHVKGAKDSSLIQPLSAVRLHAPSPGRRNFCAGANYGQHVANFLTNHGTPTTRKQVEEETRKHQPGGFTKQPFEVAGPDDDILYPSRSARFDYEAEVAAIIGPGGKGISAAQAHKHIWGFTLANDWSDRDGTEPPRMPLSFNMMKNFDRSLSLGPCIVVNEGDIGKVDVTLDVNGNRRQEHNTEQMIYSFGEYIEFLSKDLTFVPGDVLLAGTGPGTAMDMSKAGSDGKPLPELFLKPGDVVEIKSPQIGTLRNRITGGNNR